MTLNLIAQTQITRRLLALGLARLEEARQFNGSRDDPALEHRLRKLTLQLRAEIKRLERAP